MKNYHKAQEVLPQHLLDEIHEYVDGCTLYIPAKCKKRRAWGEVSGARAALTNRNDRIRGDFRSGQGIESLSNQYFLSVDTIKKIVYTR